MRPAAPIVVGHRGASGYRPEHTLAAYELAITMGADFVEPDLVPTRDGVLVARHENEISGTTDVAAHTEFADRFTTKTVDGVTVAGWFTEDFTLAELKTLRARERLSEVRPLNTAYDGRFEIPTLQEIIDLIDQKRRGPGRRIGIYPETKHPTYFRALGLPLEEPLVEVLRKNGYQGRDAPVCIQSFEVSNLQKLRTMTDLPLVQVIGDGGQPYDFVAAGDPRTCADLSAPAGLAVIAAYAQAVAAHKNLIVPRRSGGSLLTPTNFIREAHAAGLLVHAWTFRSENFFLPPALRWGDPADPDHGRQHGDAAAECRLFFELGVDGVFSDQPDVAVGVRNDVIR